MFTEKMVPIFSTVQLDIRRIPDYAGNEALVTAPTESKDNNNSSTTTTDSKNVLLTDINLGIFGQDQKKSSSSINRNIP